VHVADASREERARSLARACRDKQRGQKTREDHNRGARRSECDARFVHNVHDMRHGARRGVSVCPERMLHTRNVSRVHIYLIQYHLTILYYYYSTLHHRGITYYVLGAASRIVAIDSPICRSLIGRQPIRFPPMSHFFPGPRYQHPDDTDCLSSFSLSPRRYRFFFY